MTAVNIAIDPDRVAIFTNGILHEKAWLKIFASYRKPIVGRLRWASLWSSSGRPASRSTRSIGQ